MRTSNATSLAIGVLTASLTVGCAATPPTGPATDISHQVTAVAPIAPVANGTSNGTLVSQVDYESFASLLSETDTVPPHIDAPGPSHLPSLIDDALANNPRLAKLQSEYQAAAARSRYVDKLPDPVFGVNVFGNPLETAAGSQRANMNVGQAIPWLAKLDAQQQQACLEAMAIHAEFEAARLAVTAQVATGWYRLYVIDKQIETAVANQELLESLIDVANAGVSTGTTTQGDVLLGTLELSQLEERLLALRKQRTSVQAEMNRWIGRSAATAVVTDTTIAHNDVSLDADALLQLAMSHQPEIQAAQLRSQATRWGVEVARLSRRPEFRLSASYFMTDDNRPASSVVNVGEDPWAIGVQMSLPLRRTKYDAIANEAGWKHHAAHETLQGIVDQYDAMILEQVAEARRASETAALYDATILPQARQTLAADQDAYANSKADFDRVIRDYRTLLTLELGYHQAIGELAIARVKLEQLAGQTLGIESSDAE
ncbi:TolC family protein [Rhodopirellula sp. MGV]|uniref:TolC family protein n=1 Tax=Rhodopirellula sp. MGV TaxID=2023130 RepID=UPI000B975D63|nr:TolC family protein [Rhodopirellula sp. MGV]OYP37959.1 hypothetical protein CGZ80_03810 [Rhodopirellula sp. MGV]PNY34261.1 TolC family protein [Rhodopirellula baltica]